MIGTSGKVIAQECRNSEKRDGSAPTPLRIRNSVLRDGRAARRVRVAPSDIHERRGNKCEKI